MTALSAPPESARVAVADRFPVVATAPDGTVHRVARVIVTRATREYPPYAWIWSDRRPTPELLFCGPWTETNLTKVAGTWTLDTADGGAWSFVKARGCGCGSPLKRLQPWSPMRKGLL